MRSESSALPLHHIKTTVFTVVLVLPCISELAERSGIGTTERRLSISSRDNKSRHKCVCFLVLPCISEHAERTGIGTTERRPSISSRDSKSRHKCVCFLVLPYSSEPAERSGIGLCQQPFDSPLEVKNDCLHSRFWYSRRESNP